MVCYMENIRKEIGEVMMRRRKDSRIPRTTMAKKLGVSDVAVYYWEIGKNPIDIDMYKSYCDVLGVDWVDLLQFTKEKYNHD